MKNIAIVSILALSTFSLHAVAGPDWSVIQDARDMSLQHKAIDGNYQKNKSTDHDPFALSESRLNKQQPVVAQLNKLNQASK